jgi:hypothetical protein
MPVWHMIQIYTQNMSYLLLSTAMMIEWINVTFIHTLHFSFLTSCHCGSVVLKVGYMHDP